MRSYLAILVAVGLASQAASANFSTGDMARASRYTDQAHKDVSQEFPRLHEYLAFKLTQMARATRELTTNSVEIIPILKIQDRPEFEPSTIPHDKIGGVSSLYKFHSNIYLPVGVIDSVMSLQGYTEAQRVSILLMILAHEVGHALEIADPKAATMLAEKMADEFELSDQMRKLAQESLAQYREVHADTHAVLIAQKAGIDPSYIYVALEEFAQYEAGDLKKDVSIGHPPKETRLEFLSMILTQVRQQKGSLAPISDFTFDRKELEKVRWFMKRYRDNSGAEKYLKAKLSLSDAIIEANAFGRDSNAYGNTRTLPLLTYSEGIHVRLIYIQKLLSKKENATPENYDKFVDLALSIGNQRPLPLLLSERQVQQAFSSTGLYNKFYLEAGTYERFTRGLAKDHIANLTQALERKRQSFEKNFIAANYVLPLDILKTSSPSFFRAIVNAQAQYSGQGMAELTAIDESNRTALKTMAELTRGEVQIFSADRYSDKSHSVAFEQMNRAERMGYLLATNTMASGAASMRFMPIVSPDQVDRLGADRSRSSLIARYKNAGPRDPDALAMKKQIEKLWANRAEVAFLDLFMSRMQVDWQMVFGVVGIDTESGFKQIASDVQRLCSSPEYVNLLKDLTQALKQNGQARYGDDDTSRALKPDAAKINSAKFQWLNEEVVKAIRGENLGAEFKAQLGVKSQAALLLKEFGEVALVLATPEQIDLDYRKRLREEFLRKNPRNTKQLLSVHLTVFKEMQLWRSSNRAKSFDHRNYDHKYLSAARWDARFAGLFLETMAEGDIAANNKELVANFWNDLRTNKTYADQLIQFSEAFETQLDLKKWLSGLTGAQAQIANELVKSKPDIIDQAQKTLDGRKNSDSSFDMHWIDYSKKDETLKNAALLEKFGIVDLNDPYKMILSHRQTAGYLAHTIFAGIFSDQVIARAQKDLVQKTDATSAKAYLQELTSFLMEKSAGGNAADDPETKVTKRLSPPGVDRLRDFVWSEFAKHNPSAEEALALFKSMTSLMPSKTTDQMLRYAFDAANAGDQQKQTKIFKELETLLSEGGKTFEAATNVDIAEEILRNDLDALSNRRSHQAMDAFYDRLEKVIPAKSAARDGYLDQVAWKLNLDQAEDRAFSSLLTTSSWKSTPPWLVNAMSVAQGLAKKLSAQELTELMDYLLRKSPNAPPWLEEKFDVGADLAVENGGRNLKGAKGLTLLTSGQGHAATQAALIVLQNQIERMSPPQRAVLVSTFIRSHKIDPLKGAGSLIERYYGYKVGSSEEIHLSSFIEVLPPHERILGLSFILAHSVRADVGGKPQYGKVAEVFRAPGVKLAQLVSLWRIFNDEVSESLAESKDNTAGLDRASLTKILDSELDSEGRERLALRKRLSSASLKTTLLADLKTADGSTVPAVVAVLDPDADKQIEENLGLMKRYLETLRSRGVDQHSLFFTDLVEDFGELLREESDLRAEAEKIRIAAPVYDQIAADMKDKLNGWKFQVPRVIEGITNSKRVLVMEFAKNAVPFRQLSTELQKEVGPIFAESQLRMIYRGKLINPDFHGGNVLVDPVSKIIFPIDWGQTARINGSREKDLYRMIRLLEAIESRNIRVVLDLARTEGFLRDGTVVTEEKIAELSQRLSRAFIDASDLRGVTQKTVNAFHDSKLPLKPFYTLRMLKGILILQGENYLSSEEFMRIFKEEARRYILRNHAFDYAKDKVLGLFSRNAKPVAAVDVRATRAPKPAKVIRTCADIFSRK